MEIKNRFSIWLAICLSILILSVSQAFSATLILNPQFHSEYLGEPNAGGLVYTYEPGTSTPKTTYSDKDATTPNTNPVVLDSNGDATIYGVGSYKIVVWTDTDGDGSGDTLIKTQDNVRGINEVIFSKMSDYDDDFSAALVAIGSDDTTLLIESEIAIDEDVSLPANITLFVLESGSFAVASGKTFTIPSAKNIIAQPNQQIFSGSGTVTFTSNSEKKMATISSMAKLVDYDPGAFPSIYEVNLLGFYAEGDGGGGIFYWDNSADKADHNGGTIIDPDHTSTPGETAWYSDANVGSGCWVRSYFGALYCKWFGAKKLDTVNSTTAIQTAIDILYTANGGTLFVEDLFYVRDLQLKSQVNMIGFGPSTSKLRFYPSGTESNDASSFVILWNGAFGSLKDITVDGQKSGGFCVGNGISITQGSDNTYTRLMNNVNVEYFAGYKASPAGGTYGLRQEYAADDIRNAATGAHQLSGGNAIIVSTDEGYASNLRIESVRVTRVDGDGINLGKANDSQFHNIQIAGALRRGWVENQGNKNNLRSNVKVYLSRRLNISSFGGAPQDIIPYFGTKTTDTEAAILLTGTSHVGNMESQENGSHGFKIGVTANGLYSSNLVLTADGNGGHAAAAGAGTLANYRRYGVVLSNFYNIKLSIVADDLCAKKGLVGGNPLGRQEAGVYCAAQQTYDEFSELQLSNWYIISDNSGGADFTPLQIGVLTTSNAVGFIFQSREPSAGAGLDDSTDFGTGELKSVNDRLYLVADIKNQYTQDQETGPGWDLSNCPSVDSYFIINGERIGTDIGVASGIYDFVRDGGTIGNYVLGILPDNAVITRAWYETITDPTSAGSATIALGVETDDAIGIITATPYNDAIWDPGWHDGDPDGTAANFTTQTTAVRDVVLTIAGATLTAGKIKVFWEYSGGE